MTVKLSNMKPHIMITNRPLDELSDEAWGALQEHNRPPYLYSRGGQAVRLEIEGTDYRLTDLSTSRMRHEVARAVHWKAFKGGSIEDVFPPTDVVNDMLARPNPPLPALNRVTRVPVFDADGRLVVHEGFHAESGIYYLPLRDVEVPPVSAAPSDVEIEVAVELLQEAVCDFPFVSHADRTHALSAMIEPLVRELITGSTPVTLIDKPTPGTGGTLLAETVMYPNAAGQHVIFTQGRDEEETRRRLSSTLIPSPPAVLFDNLNHLDSATLAAAITATVFEDRILGTNKIMHLPIRNQWLATGNNPSMSHEFVRRVVRIRLDAKCEAPWLRTEFRHANLSEWIAEQHAMLIWAIATIVQSWVACGRPVPDDPILLGSFESWSRVMGGICSHAGFTDFLGNLDSYRDLNVEEATWENLFAVWYRTFGNTAVGVAEIWPHVKALEGIDLGHGDDRSQRTRFGKQLAQRRDRQLGGYRLVSAGSKQGAQRWKLVRVDENS